MAVGDRLASALAWALSQLPDDPPQPSVQGWTRADLDAWADNLAAAREVLAEAQQVPVTVSVPGTTVACVVLAAPAGSEERARQLGACGVGVKR